MKINCEYCNNEFDKPEWRIKKSKHNFCSTKCSCQVATEIRWKNHIPLKEKYKCKLCNKKIDWRNFSELCNNCLNNSLTEKSKSVTLGELKNKHNKRNIKKWYSAEIRVLNKNWNYNLSQLACQKCGYTLHSEMCHIKAIKDFNDDSTLGEINNPSNIVILCPNHHWEFDNGFLLLKDIPPIKEAYKDSATICKCGKVIRRNSDTCKSCVTRPTKITWPTNEKLIEMLKATNHFQVGKELGISDNAIRKHCKRHNIILQS